MDKAIERFRIAVQVSPDNPNYRILTAEVLLFHYLLAQLLSTGWSLS
jgi:hypothetical protein